MIEVTNCFQSFIIVKKNIWTFINRKIPYCLVVSTHKKDSCGNSIIEFITASTGEKLSININECGNNNLSKWCKIVARVK